MAHDELQEFLPKKDPDNRPKRKMISVDPEAYHSITTIAEAMGTSRTKTVAALVDYYQAEDE